MRRIALWAISTLAVLVLLFGYRTSTSSTAVASPDSSVIGPISGGSAAGAGGSITPGPGTSSPSPAGTSPVTGNVARTRYGPVQVQITVAGGRITDVSVVQYPHGNGTDEQINARAIPVLIDETLSAQSASIDMVSGASSTSEGYLTSLQSALDRAGR